MTDEQIIGLFRSIEMQLEDLHREILAICESVLPDLTQVIAMHQGKHTATEASNNWERID